MDLMPIISEDHRCGVFAAKTSVKLIIYFSNPASYSKFYELLSQVLVIFSVALREEELVCSLLEDMIVLAGVETAFFEVQFDVVIMCMVRLAENLELGEKLSQLAVEFVVTVAEDRDSGCGMMRMVRKELLVLMDMLVHVEDDPGWGNTINDDENEGELSMFRLAIAFGGGVNVPNLPTEQSVDVISPTLETQNQLLLH
ncbi:hypothetical protein P3L10_011236 [Capsicum annuum]